jgi:dUTP pyrophosphatase
MPQVDVVRLDPELPLPTYAKPGDGAVDLVARQAGTVLPGGGRFVVGTGIAVALPEGWCALVLSRSGLAARHGVIVANAPGLIDAGFRGEIMVPLLNTDATEAFVVKRGDRIAQLLVLPLDAIRWNEVEQLSDTERGAGGLGHTGV